MLVHCVRGYHKGSLFFEETSQVKLTVQNHGVMLPKFLVKFPSTCQNFVLLCKETKPSRSSLQNLTKPLGRCLQMLCVGRMFHEVCQVSYQPSLNLNQTRYQNH